MVLKLHYKRAIMCFYQVVRFLRRGFWIKRITNPKKKIKPCIIKIHFRFTLPEVHINAQIFYKSLIQFQLINYSAIHRKLLQGFSLPSLNTSSQTLLVTGGHFGTIKLLVKINVHVAHLPDLGPWDPHASFSTDWPLPDLSPS